MDWHYALDLVLFALLVVSVPIYLLLLYTLIKYRKKEQFSGSFFKLSLSLGVFDVVHLLVNWCLGKFAQLAWLGVHKLVMTRPAFFAKLTAVLWDYTAFAQKVGVLLAAVNRLTVIGSGFDWTPGWVKVTLVVHWVAPALLTAPDLCFDFNYAALNGSDGVVWYWENEVWGWRIFFACFILCTTLAAASGVCYLIIFLKTRARRQQNEQATTNSSKKAELNLAIVGFVLFILTALCGFYCYIMTNSSSPVLLSAMVPFQNILFDVYAWINPYLLLVCSANIRKHMKAVLLCRKVNAVNTVNHSHKASRTANQSRKVSRKAF